MITLKVVLFKLFGWILKVVPPFYKWIAKKINPINLEAISWDYEPPRIRDNVKNKPKFGINLILKNNCGYGIFIESLDFSLRNYQNELIKIDSHQWIKIENGKSERFCFERHIMESEMNELKAIFNENSSKAFNLEIELFLDSYFGKQRKKYELKINFDRQALEW